ncbi:EAL domain-containing protein [Pseudoduganella umbonata]|uniref:Diguanylate cyclase (GGDEF)-like protein/PAS domain S-box-containing protein n=1 Tax=Pseudoduganella umbonata TaxID=864828 RepID=A0A4P8HJ08_9BURK|nr:EAL domain-containing protein [Pseudoduganella umbonata]MBB3219480.1 diguanylate cyclase (GGDEF)-like protein/PAS domain S-box-containing protein [Pseudoduganella umbonata]QCP09563.1 EAL domain-containing protein [Pseudoduganella umbonata]
MAPLRHLTPRTLWGRMLALYSATLLCFLVLGLGTYYHLQFVREIEDVQDTAGMLAEVASLAVEDSVVVGDYETVQRTLAKTLHYSPFRAAAFIDVGGHTLRIAAPPRDGGTPPAAIVGMVAAQLYDVNRPITVGGRDYGVMRLTFDEAAIAQRLWEMIRDAALLAAACVLLSLFAMHRLLRRWLGQLTRLQRYEEDLSSGAADAAARSGDAPLEIEQAMRAVDRITHSIRSRFDQRIDTLIDSLIQHKSALDEACSVCELDPSGRIVAANDRYVTASGYSREELLTMPIDQIGELLEPRRHGRHGASTLTCEVRLADRAGRPHWHRRTVVPIFDAARNVEKYICIEIDITDRRRSEQLALAHARKHEQAAAFARCALVESDYDTLCRLLVRSAAVGLQAECAALLQHADSGERCVAVWPPLHPDARAEADAGTGGGTGRAEVALRWGEARGVLAVQGPAEEGFTDHDRYFLDNLAGTFANAVERHDSSLQLRYLATHDPLTSLPNRAAFGDRLATTIADGGVVQLLVIDLDHFKNVNDTLGHAAGDALLVEATHRLQAALPRRAFVARLGGDEFAVICPPGFTDEAADACAEALVDSLHRPFVLDGQQVFIGASIGIACAPRDGSAADDLVRNADTAMYAAKQHGRARGCRFQGEMNARVARRVALESGLRGALDAGEFTLAYQPKQDVASGRLTGFEALLRWNGPAGPVQPTEFVPVLEDTGMILPVGTWVIHSVCAQVRAWRDAGMPPVPVAVNLSARQFQQDDLVDVILAATRDAGISPSALEFELTESMLMSDPAAAEGILLRLKAAGIGLSIDDFGTGYSSLSYLKRFPLDALKIDRAFVRDLPADSEDLAITRAVIALAHSLGLRVIAEGVEDAAQLASLRANGCDEIQGYLYGEPLPAADCLAIFTGKVLEKTVA